MKQIRAKYQAHVSADAEAGRLRRYRCPRARVIALEHAIAEKHWTLDETEDIHKANNPWKQADFAAKLRGWIGRNTSAAPA